MRRFLIVIGIILLLGLAIGVPYYLHLLSLRKACLREMAACEATLTTIAGKLRIYALAHHNQFPDSDAKLEKALGGPLPDHYIYCPGEMVPKGSANLDWIVIDKTRHYPDRMLERLYMIPEQRIHALMDDLSIIRVTTPNAF